MDEKYNVVISLGSNCVVAEQARRHLPETANSVFDWIVTPWSSIMTVLNDRADRISRNMSVVNSGRSVLCEEYGVLYHHEYPRTFDGRVSFSARDIEKSRGKLLHKCEMMFEAMRELRPLFVRYGVTTDLPVDEHRDHPLYYSELNSLVESLRNFCGHENFHLVLIEVEGNWNEKVVEDVGLSRLASHVKTGRQVETLGDNSFWREFFGTWGFDLKPAAS